MIEVNLLPGGARKKSSAAPSAAQVGAMLSGLSGKLANGWLIGCAVVMLAAAGVGGWLYFGQKAYKKDSEERLAKALEDSARFSGIVAARAALEAKRDTLLRQVNLIRTIDGDRYIWPHILDEVSKVLPPYTWLTVVAFIGTPAGATNVVAVPVVKINPIDTVGGKKPPKAQITEITPDVVAFRVTGQTVDIQAFTKYMEDLEASPFLGGVNMISVTPLNVEGKEVFVFVVNMTYTRPDSTVIRRLPLVSTVR
jgi:Tfp pilus assembly protein PilN